MDTLERINQLLALVDEITAEKYAIAEGPKWEQFCQLDAEIAGECEYLGARMQSYGFAVRSGTSRVPFGFVKIPRGMTNLGWRVEAPEEWRQAMRGLKATVRIALERQIDPHDIATAKTQGAIADFADEEFRERPSERSIQKWLAEGSLRSRRRGQLWEFSKSDLRTLVLGKSD